MRRLFLHWKSIALVTAAMLAGGASLVVGDGTKADAAKEVHALAGGGEAGIAVELFLPDNLAVNVGDTVTWTNPYIEPHTVTYLVNEDDLVDEFAPIGTPGATNFDATESISSGVFGQGETYSITFDVTGTYTFLCLLHPGMEVDVTVIPEGTETPPVDFERAQATIDEGVALGEKAAKEAAKAVPDPEKNDYGKKTWTVPSSPSVPFEGATVDVMRFIPAEVNISEGDTVRWENLTAVPHTVTFGQPSEGFDPFVPAKPSQKFDPDEFYNSGFMGTVPAWLGGTEFSLTFKEAGTYTYICVLHADQGMAGVIHVAESDDKDYDKDDKDKDHDKDYDKDKKDRHDKDDKKDKDDSNVGTITPPDTGDAGMLDRSSGSWMMLTGAALLIAGFGASAMAFVGRRV